MKKNDIISEREFNREIEKQRLPGPEIDSPGDSEESVEEEFLMGMDFDPEEGEEEDDMVRGTDFEREIPENARAVSSESPSPRADDGKPTSTH